MVPRHLHHGQPAGATPVASAANPSVLTPAPGCLEILANRLREEPGVIAIEADFRGSTLTVRYQPSQLTPEALNQLADEVGQVFAQRVTTCERRERWDACAECALRLGRLDPEAASEFQASAAPGRVLLARRRPAEGVVEVVRPLTEKPWGARMSPAEQEQHAEGRGMAVLTAVCFTALVSGMIVEWAGGPRWLAPALFLASAASGGWFTARSTLAALAERRFDVNLLMLLSAIGASLIGYLHEAAVLMFLFSLSNTLEVHTMGRTRRALHALLALRPQRALVRRGESEELVEIESVRVGETVIIKPGESVPVDGTVTRGESLVDQSSLTGESVPVAKQPGATLFAGTLNQHGALEMLATRVAANSAIARIVALVQEAQEQKSRTEVMAEWVGRYYTIAVMVGAALMVFLPPLVFGHDWKESFYRAMTLLVVASPCALVIATPATVLSAIANAARNGILFKGGAHLEALGQVRVVAFDKTGTLTRGRFEITHVEPVAGFDADGLLRVAAGAEKRSPHPLAQAVVRAAEAKGLEVTAAESLTNHVGKGLVAMVEGRPVAIGTPELFATLGQPAPAPALERVAEHAREARTAMIVHEGGRWGVLAAADRLRDNARSTVDALRRAGIAHVALLSGDSIHTVAAIAGRVGVDEQHGQLLPEDKVQVVAGLEQRHGPVAMVGDGVNDAPALARARVGIAMGGIGSDAAMESADVVLMSDDLAALPYAVRLARRARVVVAQNLVIAVGVMAALVAWVFLGDHMPFGALKLPIAVSGHEGSTVLVILNGLRLLAGRRDAA